MAPSWRVQFLTDTQSTAGQSGGELVGAHGAKLYAREHAAIRKSSNKRLVPFFYILRSHFWGRNLDPKLGPPICPAITIRQKSLTPFLGPKTRLVLFRGPACCNLIFALSGDSFLADGSLRGCQVCRQGGVVFERGGNLAWKTFDGKRAPSTTSCSI